MIKTSDLLNAFCEYDIPSFPCPCCGSALALTKDSLKTRASAETIHLYDVGAIDQHEGSGVFVLTLDCPSKSCKESVAVSGSCTYGPYNSPDDELIAAYLKPHYFTPSLHIFPISENCPERVKKALVSSFSLFWSSPQAAGNALRTAVEAFLDYQGVRKWTKNNKNEEVVIFLDARINEYAKISADIAEVLMAIKWIGNAGSHLSDLTHDNVIMGYRLFSHAMDETFDKKSATIKKMAQRINSKKKPFKGRNP
jgi:hypothetical protein